MRHLLSILAVISVLIFIGCAAGEDSDANGSSPVPSIEVNASTLETNTTTPEINTTTPESNSTVGFLDDFIEDSISTLDINGSIINATFGFQTNTNKIVVTTDKGVFTFSKGLGAYRLSSSITFPKYTVVIGSLLSNDGNFLIVVTFRHIYFYQYVTGGAMTLVADQPAYNDYYYTGTGGGFISIEPSPDHTEAIVIEKRCNEFSLCPEARVLSYSLIVNKLHDRPIYNYFYTMTEALIRFIPSTFSNTYSAYFDRRQYRGFNTLYGTTGVIIYDKTQVESDVMHGDDFESDARVVAILNDARYIQFMQNEQLAYVSNSGFYASTGLNSAAPLVIPDSRFAELETLTKPPIPFYNAGGSSTGISAGFNSNHMIIPKDGEVILYDVTNTSQPKKKSFMGIDKLYDVTSDWEFAIVLPDPNMQYEPYNNQLFVVDFEKLPYTTEFINDEKVMIVAP